MSLEKHKAKRVSVIRVILVLLGTGLHPVWAEENRPTIDTIDFYGLRTVTEQELRAKLGIKEGDPSPVSSHDVETGLQKIPHVARARLNPITIPGGKIALFVGIEETGAPSFHYRPGPVGSAVLPNEMVEAERQLWEALSKMVQSGVGNTEDDSQGHALVQNPAVRAGQEKFIQLAKSGGEILHEVLNQSADPEQRAIAAWILGYGPDKRLVIGDLMDAVRDPDPVVRNNATRSVGAIAELATRRPELGIQIDPTPFIDMLNSLDWTDRNKAMMVLGNLSERRPQAIMASLQKQAVPSLVEMARWKAAYARSSFVLLARLAGLDEKDILNTWVDRTERERIITQVAQSRL